MKPTPLIDLEPPFEDVTAANKMTRLDPPPRSLRIIDGCATFAFGMVAGALIVSAIFLILYH